MSHVAFELGSITVWITTLAPLAILAWWLVVARSRRWQDWWAVHLIILAAGFAWNDVLSALVDPFVRSMIRHSYEIASIHHEALGSAVVTGLRLMDFLGYLPVLIGALLVIRGWQHKTVPASSEGPWA